MRSDLSQHSHAGILTNRSETTCWLHLYDVAIEVRYIKSDNRCFWMGSQPDPLHFTPGNFVLRGYHLVIFGGIVKYVD